MPWFKVDDKLHSHTKAAKAGEALSLWVVAGSWSMDHLTDGFVPDYIAARLMPNFEQHAATLVRVGLWSEAEQGGDVGWLFHDWSVHQPSREQVEEERRKARERMANRRRSSGDVRANTVGTSDAVRLPRPDPTRPESSTNSEAATPSRRKPAKRLPDDWQPNDRHREIAEERGVDLQREVFTFRNHAQSNDRRQADWNAAFRTWLGNAKPAQRPGKSAWERATKIGDGW
jgi:hypothetical protein